VPIVPDELVVPEPPVEEESSSGDDGGGPTSVYTERGGGTDWSWGVWETDGILDKVEFKSSSIISATDIQAIMDGATRYDLTGSGTAAAVIRYAGASKLVEGTADLFVQIGNSIAPNWDGTFSMNNIDGDSLDFDASGTIQRDGLLTGNQTAYSMLVNGASFDRSSITAESITGHLVGPGASATPPITGAIGSFHFDHGGTATVDGGFGSDIFSAAAAK
jgi:hypothetical protein